MDPTKRFPGWFRPEKRKREACAQALDQGQAAILESCARGAPLSQILESIVLLIESLEPGLACSVLLVENGRIRHGAAPSLPAEYNAAIDGREIGPSEGSCGAAAYLGERVIVEDIARHPNWFKFRDLALKHDLRACWSSPIFSPDRSVLGTFAIYRKVPCRPSADELLWIDRATHLAAIAIQKHKVESTLRSSQDQYRTITEAASDVILATDEHGVVLVANQALASTFGYAPAEVVGQDITMLMPRDLRIKHRQAFALYLRTGARRKDWRQVSTTGLRKNGEEFPIVVSFGEQDDGHQRLFTGVIRDATAAKATEDALRKAKEHAEAANEAKTSFIANMSHELRTPLAVILGFSELLAKSDLHSTERLSFYRDIQRNGESLRRIIDDVLDLAKVESGALQYQFSPVHLPDLIADVCSSFEWECRKKGITLSVTREAGGPEDLETDPGRLRQVLTNVVGNAVKFTDKGEVQIAARTEQVLGSPSRLVIDVRDTGPGIDEAQRGALFQRFSQIDASLTRRHGGSGLGLVLSRQIARGLGGDIELAASAPGIGSTFSIKLPVKSTSAETTAAKNNVPRESPSARLTLRGIKVLIAEDCFDLQTFCTHVLQEAGANVISAGDGKAAIEMVRRNAPDIVLMDLQMPVLDGYDATRQLRADGCDIPIVSLSAHVLPAERSKAIAAGCTSHLNKPIASDALLGEIVRCVENYRQGAIS